MLYPGSPQPVTEQSGDTGAWPFLPNVGFLHCVTSAPELSLGLAETLPDLHLGPRLGPSSLLLLFHFSPAFTVLLPPPNTPLALLTPTQSLLPGGGNGPPLGEGK